MAIEKELLDQLLSGRDPKELFAKRLERGRFIWPTTHGDAVTITPAQLGYLLEGIDWRAPIRTQRPELVG